jgi:O-6-methylguanine DNA methyltransferase
MNMKTALIQTADGNFTAHFSGKGLAGLDFPTDATILPIATNELPSPWDFWLRLTERALKHALAGKAPGPLPPLDLSSGTEFQRCVWNALRKIPSGQTMSYAQVAQAIGRPEAMRAVGQACGANPIPVVIPCHRVLAAGGKIGGFSSGLDWKRRLLTREGAMPESTNSRSTHQSSSAAGHSHAG